MVQVAWLLMSLLSLSFSSSFEQVGEQVGIPGHCCCLLLLIRSIILAQDLQGKALLKSMHDTLGNIVSDSH